jgi:hypothetical protein
MDAALVAPTEQLDEQRVEAIQPHHIEGRQRNRRRGKPARELLQGCVCGREPEQCRRRRASRE